ncbi:MAG: hypothetical protein HKP48_03650 [Winogradskyella sp.]|uniref:hypothetical protein n=1 Tax=Winogradskyella sp. TaxID=1883156 RepID=UPI001791E61C|nr:hypothetical protein [Winogradskyella sp.]MBT8244447.1 hypothetical protein [Winogradskyella sp.]NNK22399.1 hypothetical protein [Winogradskyella sp.]
MSGRKKLLLFFLSLIAILLLISIWYNYNYSMETAEEFKVNSPELSRKLLIATQGSEFKDEVTKGVVTHFKNDSVFIKVIDVSSLKLINPKDYTALVVIHTWENWKAPEDVELFINRTKENLNKIIVLTTSGEGSYKMENVDAITGESKLDNTDTYINEILKRLNPILTPKSI